MSELEKAARQARGYLNGLIRGLRMGDDSEAAKVLAAIDIALEQQITEEPPVLAELNCVCGAVWEWRNRDWKLMESPQPAAQWVGLTDEYLENLLMTYGYDADDDCMKEMLRDHEAKLREKNGGKA